ncbi:MAG TPA: GNAT family N-acetyltransferase [Solirubrobacteraceae bacterium]|nr:GNAT family N-acetyltransferase [Solirubrobacteraceae bacterium]
MSEDAEVRSADAPTYVAQSGEQVVGMVTLCVFRTLTGPKAYLDHLVVSPDCRQRGIGRALVRHAIEQARAAGRRASIWPLRRVGPCRRREARPSEPRAPSAHWTKAGADTHPPIVARGVLIDVAAAAGVSVLPDSFGIGETQLKEALARQGTTVQRGDVVLVRTGRMTLWPDAAAYIPDEPGLNREGAEYLAKCGATFLLAEAGIPILEVADLEELSREKVYEFAFIAACLRIRGATGSPLRPIAMPLRRR